MRAEIIVFLVVFVISALVVDWACLITASKADERAKIDEEELEKERKRKTEEENERKE